MNLLNRLFGRKPNNVRPSIDLNYACESCGSIDGKCHPKTTMCWHCGADDFLPMEAFKLGKEFFRKMIAKTRTKDYPDKEYFFDQDGNFIYAFEDEAYWIVTRGEVHHGEDRYLAYSSHYHQTESI